MGPGGPDGPSISALWTVRVDFVDQRKYAGGRVTGSRHDSVSSSDHAPADEIPGDDEEVGVGLRRDREDGALRLDEDLDDVSLGDPFRGHDSGNLLKEI